MVELKTTSALYRHLTGLAGTFEVGKQLALRGYNVSLTQRNFPHVDLFVQNQANMKSIPIQVKASRKPNSGGFDLCKENLVAQELIIVMVVLEDTEDGKPEFFIAKPSEAINEIECEKRPGISRKRILELKWKDRWDVIEKALT